MCLGFPYGFVGDDVFAYGQPSATAAKAKREFNGAANDAVPAHDLGRLVA